MQIYTFYRVMNNNQRYIRVCKRG